MATKDDVEQALLDAIEREAKDDLYPMAGTKARDYAEALAWLTRPNQPHGGCTTATTA